MIAASLCFVLAAAGAGDPHQQVAASAPVVEHAHQVAPPETQAGHVYVFPERPPGLARTSGYYWHRHLQKYPAFNESLYRQGYNERVGFDYVWSRRSSEPLWLTYPWLTPHCYVPREERIVAIDQPVEVIIPKPEFEYLPPELLGRPFALAEPGAPVPVPQESELSAETLGSPRHLRPYRPEPPAFAPKPTPTRILTIRPRY